MPFDILRKPFSRNTEVIATRFELPPGIELDEAGTLQTTNKELGMGLYLTRRKPQDGDKYDMRKNVVIKAFIHALPGNQKAVLDESEDRITKEEAQKVFGIDYADDDAFVDLGTKFCLRFQNYSPGANIPSDLLAEILPELEEYRKKK